VSGASLDHFWTALRWPTWLPPARVVSLCLLVLAAYGTVVLRGMSLPSLVVLPTLAAGVDIGFQRVRFLSVRWPDAAVASGLFLTLLLPPAVPLVAAATVTIGAVVLRHSLRYRGRPLFNPAATGLLMGAVLFGTAPAWWVALGVRGEWLMLGLAAILLARNRSQWRLPATFFAIYAPFTLVNRVLFGAALAPHVLLLEVFDPAILFFGLYMVVEPRTSPISSEGQVLFAGVVALGAAFLPSVLPSLGVIVALLIGNMVAVGIRSIHPRTTTVETANDRARARRSRSLPTAAARWSAGRRAGTALLVLIALGVVAAASAGPTSTPSVLVSTPPSSGGGGSGGSAPCAQDNPSIPPSTVTALHQALGPSVILSYSSNSGTVVFYDPVNQVTVTETDLYEDYGAAEFNGDDFAVSGCAP
jgi:enediyne biosynthesis protein E5